MNICEKTRLNVKSAVSEIRQLKSFMDVYYSGIEPVAEWLAGDEQIQPFERLTRVALIDFIADEQKYQWPYISSIVVPRLWTILESTIGEFVGRRLLDGADCPDDGVVESMKGSIVGFSEMTEIRKQMALFRLLKARLVQPQPGVAQFERYLEFIGLQGPMHESVERVFLEFNEVKHIIVDQNGIVDTTLLILWPCETQELGRRIRLIPEWVDLAIDAVVWYLLEIDRRGLQVVGVAQNEHRRNRQDALADNIWMMLGGEYESDVVDVAARSGLSFNELNLIELTEEDRAQLFDNWDLPDDRQPQPPCPHYFEDTRWIDEVRFEPLADEVESPADKYELPADDFEPPSDSFEPPADYEPPPSERE